MITDAAFITPQHLGRVMGTSGFCRLTIHTALRRNVVVPPRVTLGKQRASPCWRQPQRQKASSMASSKYGPLVGAVDQGTSSTRFLVFASKTAELLTYHQVEIQQFYPKEGWVEEDPKEIMQTVVTCIEKTIENLRNLDLDPADIQAIGVTNQRETTILWDKVTGQPLHNAIVWLDTRTTDTVQMFIQKTPGKNKEFLQHKCGLPLSSYFSAVKIHWLKKNVPEVAKAIEEDRCMFGTVDSWILWNLTGGSNKGIHCTDVTNASRTMLMNIDTLEWDPELCKFFGIPKKILPEIRSSSEIYGYISSGALKGVPISGCLGDQSAALVGQMCFRSGMAKNTYGTGCFLLYNTGQEPIFSQHGLLTTVGYKFGKNKPPVYALEGSVAIAGASIRWLRDNLGIIKSSEEIEKLAESVGGTHGVYFVPAFSGLYAPYWEPDARGLVIGLTQFTTKAHLARSALEAICFQTREILDAMYKDSGISLTSLQVDGGMCNNSLLMQIQADLIGIPVVRPSMPETTALGAAMAAGAAEGIEVWKLDADDATPITTDSFYPMIADRDRNFRYGRWKQAIKRSMFWEGKGLEEAEDFAEGKAIVRTLPGGIFLISSFVFLVLAQRS